MKNVTELHGQTRRQAGTQTDELPDVYTGKRVTYYPQNTQKKTAIEN